MCERFFESAADGRSCVEHRHAGALPAATDVGADRVVNAVAAYEAFGRAEAIPLIVVDFGTATTFDAISKRGRIHRRRHLLRGSVFRRTPCFNAPRGCRGSTSESRRR